MSRLMEQTRSTEKLDTAAWDVIRDASDAHGIRAAAQQQDNYRRIWARDSVVTGLAILLHDHSALMPAFKASLQQLAKAAAPNGQIPSNVSLADDGQMAAVSFGGPVGRTDCSFWWIIGAVNYLQRLPEESFRVQVLDQTEKIFQLAQAWEFNYQGLMHLPVSSNWADEYITGGYVLYDQLLRYWALLLAGECFNRTDWLAKADDVKLSIKKHFCGEAELDASLFTASQRKQLQAAKGEPAFICAFSATQLIQRYDAWSIALLLALNIPSESSRAGLLEAIRKEWDTCRIGLPAFWPVIEESDPEYRQLLSNHSYRFKNRPGHFHNGGIWPVVNGFLVAAFQLIGEPAMADALLQSLQSLLERHADTHPFPEYVTRTDHQPGGLSRLCFSAAGWLWAVQSRSQIMRLQKIMAHPSQQKKAAAAAAQELAQAVIGRVQIEAGKPFAISVAGESGCGKTTLALALQDAFGKQGMKSIVLHQDDFFYLPPRQNHEQRLKDFSHIGPQEVNLVQLNETIQLIQQQTTPLLTIPVMNWITDTREFKEIDVRQTAVIIVEGTYCSLLPAVDYRVFFAATYRQTRAQRIARNRETVTDFIEQVLEKESQIIQSHRERAQLVIDPDNRCSY